VTGELPHDGHPAPAGGLRAAVARRGSLLRTLKAVAWSFFGVRKSRDQAGDLEQLNPLHVVIAGVFAAAVLVGALIALVRWIISSGVAR
jgi:hypothetical protein